MKKLQVAINLIYNIEVEDDFNFIEEAEVGRVVEEYLNSNNQIAYNEFFENIKVICSGCGVSLSSEEEREDGKCVQCDNIKQCGNCNREIDDDGIVSNTINRCSRCKDL